jgi:hypothetical protein
MLKKVFGFLVMTLLMSVQAQIIDMTGGGGYPTGGVPAAGAPTGGTPPV